MTKTGSLVRKILVYKYIFIITLSSFTAFVIWHYFANEVHLKDVLASFFSALITALLFSLFYDLFTRKEQNLRTNEDRQMLLSEFTSSFWQTIDIDTISDVQKEDFVRRLVQNQQTLEILAKAISGQGSSRFLSTHLSNLSKGNILFDVEVTNTLKPCTGDSNSYWLDFSQRFSIPPGEKKDFLVLFSSNNEFFNRLVASPTVIDSMVGVSESDWSTLSSLLPLMKLRASRTLSGHRETKEVLYKEVVGIVLQQRLGLVPKDNRSVRGFLFSLPPEPDSYQYVFTYRVMNSLLDPYYCWFAENPMHVRSVTIDYSEMKETVGRVSANCFIGNYTGDPLDDQAGGIYRIDVDGLLWPGQGTLIVWRPQTQLLASQAPPPTPLPVPPEQDP